RAATTPIASTRARSPSSNATIDPSAPSPDPAAIPPSVEPLTKAATVTPHRRPRARSPSGVMLPSIDAPQGDHVERIAPTSARATPARTAGSADTLTCPVRDERVVLDRVAEQRAHLLP